MAAHGTDARQAPAATPRPAWRRWFVAGLVLWVLTVAVTYWTQISTLLPTVILLGSFLVPTTFVLWAFETKARPGLPPLAVLKAFVVGGVLGVLGAALLESALLTGERLVGVWFAIGFLEEAAKLAALWWVARDLVVRTRRDGMVLGAAVGFGFAAFETAGYALNAVVTTDGYDLRALIETEVLRAVLAPVGHGLWTAVLGGALFASAAGTGRFRITKELSLTYVAMSLLHGLWNASGTFAALVVWFATVQDWQLRLLEEERIPSPTAQQVHLQGSLTWLMLRGGAVWGVVVLHRRWRQAEAEDAETAAAAADPDDEDPA